MKRIKYFFLSLILLTSSFSATYASSNSLSSSYIIDKSFLETDLNRKKNYSTFQFKATPTLSRSYSTGRQSSPWNFRAIRPFKRPLIVVSALGTTIGAGIYLFKQGLEAENIGNHPNTQPFHKNSNDSEQSRAEEKIKRLFIMLPINHLGKNKVSLSVEISEDYRCLQRIPSEMMEFIAKREDEQKWSQIITLQVYRGLNISAPTFLENLKDIMQQHTQTFKVFREDKKDFSNYKMASMGVIYEANGRKEAMFSQYFSGPADLCGIQHTRVLDKNDSPEEVLKRLIEATNKISKVVE
ncbi:MAG: hypothetical protein IBJ00_05150 [Alphaproteobacteria bacterium]|nr:hypothetical protein [Alphaproteobacteria bacterium]